MTDSPGRAVRPPQQARSIATRKLILDTARDLLVERGWEGFTIAQISQRSGVSVGGIYQHFGDKDGLFTVLHDDHLDHFSQRFTATFDLHRWSGYADPRELVYDVVAALGKLFEEFGDVNAVMMINSTRVPGLAERGGLMVTDLRRRVTDVLRTRSADYPTGDTENAIAVAYRIAFATFLDFATWHKLPTHAHDMSWDRLIDQVAGICANYLVGSANTNAP